MFDKKELNGIYPLITMAMAVWQILPVALCTLVLGALVNYATISLITLMICGGVAVVIYVFCVFNLLRMLMARQWVRSRAIGYGYGVIYLADTDAHRGPLIAEVSRLCHSDAVGLVLDMMEFTSPELQGLKRPYPLLVIISDDVFAARDLNAKKWRIMGLDLGVRIYVPWRGSNLRRLRDYLGSSMGEAIIRVTCPSWSKDEVYLAVSQASAYIVFTSYSRDKTVPTLTVPAVQAPQEEN